MGRASTMAGGWRIGCWSAFNGARNAVTTLLSAGLFTIVALGVVLSGLPRALAADEVAIDVAKETAKGDSPLLITLGSYGVYGPRFEGSKRHDVAPWPIISWRNAGDKEWLELPKDGIDLALIETENFRFGPVGYWRFQRDVSTIQQRGFARVGHGKSSIDLSIEGGLFAEYWPAEWLRTRVEAREALFGASGLIGNISSDVVWRPTSKWTFAAGPRLSVADAEFMDSYYGVTYGQSATSGLPVYRAEAGLRSFGAGAFAKYKITPEWTTQGFFEYEHLTGSAGDSPVITTRGSREQFMLGLGLSYTFKAPWEK